ncbi:MAG: D-alanine--D-alanine ligase [Candidatus Omnitrophota bacterium]
MLVNKALVKNLRIAVLMGGRSSEREISLKSGRAVYQTLKDADCKVWPFDITEEDPDKIISGLKEIDADLAFIAMHGSFGEDGTLQEILESAEIPYTGSGPRASRLAMDKIASRGVFKRQNIPVPGCLVFEDSLFSKIDLDELDFLGLPLVVKPAGAGSSIGVSFVMRKEELLPAVELAFSHGRRIIIEECLKGREITVGILSNEPLPVIEVVPKLEFFNFQAKYTPGLTDYIVPAKLDPRIAKNAQDIALLAHESLGCRTFSRVDMILKEDTPYVLEINTIPGFTQTSLLPKAAAFKNISFLDLCLKVISLSVVPHFIKKNEKESINLKSGF